VQLLLFFPNKGKNHHSTNQVVEIENFLKKIWGREEVEKTNNFGQGGCVFGSSPKMVSTTSSSTGALVAAGSLWPSGWWAGLVGSHGLCAICCTLSGSTGPGIC
jgi:hypothetical protein